MELFQFPAILTRDRHLVQMVQMRFRFPTAFSAIAARTQDYTHNYHLHQKRTTNVNQFFCANFLRVLVKKKTELQTLFASWEWMEHSTGKKNGVLCSVDKETLNFSIWLVMFIREKVSKALASGFRDSRFVEEWSPGGESTTERRLNLVQREATETTKNCSEAIFFCQINSASLKCRLWHHCH